MFLALKEMRYAKLRYGLIIGIMLLVSFVVFLLSGLASGLAQEFMQAAGDWQADTVVLAKDANKSLNASQLTLQDFDDVATTSKKAPISIYNGAAKLNKKNTDITLFGTDSEAFMLPKVTKGSNELTKNNIIISQNLADEGYQIGDKITIGKYAEKLTIIGIFKATYYTVTPVIYSDTETFVNVKFNGQIPQDKNQIPINGILVKKGSPDFTTEQKEDFDSLSLAEFIEAIPGYSAQNLTLNGMIYFLFIVVAAVIGIFMYVMTLQKTATFGIMKAEGISTGFIAKSIIAQSFIVGVIGVIGAAVLAFLTSLILPSAMPFQIIVNDWLLYGIVLLVVAVIGGLFSIRTVTKVDPITAIGG
ncbi:ABC transporter permease [Enterococcus saigonensis]|uniref:Putative hemin transport system permease protein HrtB n=1 Tax=Enterococcus saigonensis TaxID=1805431 RepID=A0A679II84_9ENTE|nr:ABC transporter permease [Enterococcus saigonensis]BCA84806.1 ABC transporter permease [Enterococcus saigonensis]